MSIIIGAASSDSKNVWKIDDDLTTIEDSALVSTTAEQVDCLRQDSAGNVYAGANNATTTNLVEKLDSDLALVTGWGTAGQVDPAGATIHAIAATLGAGKILIGSSTDMHLYDGDGAATWVDKPAGANDPYTACAFDLSEELLFAFSDTGGGTMRLHRLSLSAGAVVTRNGDSGFGVPFSGNTADATGIIVDRANFQNPAHVYLHVFHNSLGKIYCYDPDKMVSALWNNTTNIVGNQGGNNSSAAIDSSGNLYICGGRANSLSVLKIDPTDGSITASFDTGSTAQAIYIDSSDQIFVVGNRSGSKCVWRLNTSLVEQASLATTVLDVDVLAITGGRASASVVAPKDVKYKKKLVAIAKDEVWHENPAGTMVVVSDSQSGGLVATNPLTAAEAFQKAFIANASVLKVVRFADARLATNDLTAASLVPPHGDILTQATTGAKMVVDYVSADRGTVYGFTTTSTAFNATNIVSSGNVALSILIASVVTAATASKPFFHNYTVYPNVSTTPKTYGSLPDKATLIALYRGRVVLSGNPAYPFQWYMSRQNNPYDFAYVANDPQAPVAGGNADAGELGDTITALIPYKDDYLVFGCTSTIWVMRGDPAAGGSLDEVSLTTGIFGPASHCWDDKDNLYFFGSGGVYRIPPGFGPPENLTIGVLPNLITDLGIDPSTHRIVMAYDRRRVGVLIAITALATGSNINYWFDLKTEAFFPETYPGECGIYAATFYEAQTADYRRLLVGGRDAYIRYFLDSAKDDDAGTTDDAIGSYVTFGPVQLAQDADAEGKIISLTIITGTSTDGLSYDVHVADSAEETIDAVVAGSTPFLTGTVQVDNRVAKIRIKCRGIYALVRIFNSTASQTWSCEKIVAQVSEGGRR